MDMDLGWTRSTRILIISCTLPLKFDYNNDTDEWDVEWNDDHLIESHHTFSHDILSQTEYTFLGLPHSFIPKEDQSRIKTLCKPFHCVPLFPQEEIVLDFLNYCHTTLYPLFHHTTGQEHNTKTTCLVQHEMQEKKWMAYTKINSIFAKGIDEIYSTGSIVWIHDYQLML